MRSPLPARLIAARPARLTAALAAVALAASGGVLASEAAHAAEDAPRPRSGAYQLDGNGFGHGRGMSQRGANGAAAQGRTWQQIFAFYFPGTVPSTLPETSFRVWISADTDNDTQVLAAPGLRVVVGRRSTALPHGDAYRAWRAVRSGTGVSVQYRNPSGRWVPVRDGAGPAVAFVGGNGLVRVLLPNGTSQDVRGSVAAVRDGSRLRTITWQSTESYLRSVVPREMPATYHPAALDAQAIAARTFGARYRDRMRAKGAFYDVCDTTTCQVFRGVTSYDRRGRTEINEDPRTNAAVARTTGRVLREGRGAGAKLAFAEFGDSSGGYTAKGDHPYQPAQPDPYDGFYPSTAHQWRVRVPVSTIEAAFPGAGSLRTLQVLGRDGNGRGGGRIDRIAVVGSRGTVTVTGERFRFALGLRSHWFTIAPAR